MIKHCKNYSFKTELSNIAENTNHQNTSLKNKSLKKNALLNAIKQLCQIVFPVISFSYSSHVLGAENIGIFNFSGSIVGYFSLFAALGIGIFAIREGAQLRENQEKFDKFASEIFSLNIVSTLISYVLLAILLVFWKKLDPYRLFIFIQSITILLTTIGADWVNMVFEDYLYITIRYIIVQIVSIIMLLLFVKTANDLITYTVIKVIAESGSMLLNFFYIKRYVHLKFLFNFKRHILPIMLLFGNQVAVTIYVNSDITILGILTNDTQVGIYSTAAKIYNLIKRLVYSVITVALPRFAYLTARDDDNTICNLYRKMTMLVMFVALPTAVGLMCESKNILYIMAGSEYISGSLSLIILCPAIVLVAISNLVVNCLIIPRRKDTVLLFTTIFSAIINIVLNFMLIPYWGINAAAFTTLLSEIIVASIYVFSIRNIVENWLDIPYTVQICSGCLLIWCICCFVNRLPISEFSQLASSIVISTGGYATAMLLIRKVFHNNGGTVKC